MSATLQSAFFRVGQLASLPAVHAAFRWFHLQERRVMQWQHDLVAIPAPPFGEGARAAWLEARFREAGLEEVQIDAEGNVLGWLRGEARNAECVLLSAHIDTVFPAGTRIAPVLTEGRLEAPGACDNGAGVAALLAIAAALGSCRLPLAGDVLVAGNVGEEGEGDLRGVRYLYGSSPGRERIAAHLVLDGAGANYAVTRALGSQRYRVTVRGPGGHSWADAGAPNPIVALSGAITALGEVDLPEAARTTLNVGAIEGGTSINSIPERAAARFDLRSLERQELLRLESELKRAVKEAVQTVNDRAGNDRAGNDRAGNDRRKAGKDLPAASLEFEIEQIGSRPAGELPADSPLLGALRAADRHLGIRTEERVASTDANLPLSLGIPALALGAGGSGGGVHTEAEWYESHGREAALKRILLLLLGALALPGELTSDTAPEI